MNSTNPSYKFVLLLGILAFGISSASGEPDYRRESKDLQKTLKPLLTQRDAAGQFLTVLREQQTQEEVNVALVAFARSIDKAKNWNLAVEVSDRLREQGGLQNEILAAEVLFKTIDCAKDADKMKAAPILDRAAGFLGHEDPIVQSLGDWTMNLYVQRHNYRQNMVKNFFTAGSEDAAWYPAWKARSDGKDVVDDYGRQLVYLNRHRDVEGVREDVGKQHDRLTAMLQSPTGGGQPSEATLARYSNALQDVRSACDNQDLLSAHRAYINYRLVVREVIQEVRPEFPQEGFVFSTAHVMKGGGTNVNGAVIAPLTHPPAHDLKIKRNADPASPAESLLPADLGPGTLHGIDLEWEGSRVAFSFVQKPYDDKNIRGFDQSDMAHIYVIDLNTLEVTQITDSQVNNDIEPAFLPDGGFVFASDRSNFGNQCAGAFLQDKRCTTLYRLDDDRHPEPIAISNNKDFDRFPTVLNDGTIGFMHWEYQERGFYNQHTLWSCRPDGTNMDAMYKQHIDTPMSVRVVKQIPNSPLFVGTMQGHHDGHYGPIVIFNPSKGINNTEAMWSATPGVGGVEGGLGPLEEQFVEEGGVENRGGYFVDPFPMSEKAFIAGHDMSGDKAEFALYYVDVWGNRELLHREDETACFEPFPLRPRARPPVIPDTIDPEADHATVFVENVYRDLPGVEHGAVKYLRISQKLPLPAPADDDTGKGYNHLHWLPGGVLSGHLGAWSWSPTRNIGIVEVNEDGSAFFKVPAGTPVFLQALDENYCEVRRMRTSFTLQRGEFRSCVGCHESRLETAGSRPNYPVGTFQSGPQVPEPPSWGDRTVLDFEKHVQPILNKHCVSCHGEDDPEGGLEFTERKIGGFMQSYRTMFGLSAEDPTPVTEMDIHLTLNPDAADDKYFTEKEANEILKKSMAYNEYPGMLVKISDRMEQNASITMPYQYGSNVSKLIRTLLDDEKHREEVKAEMTTDEWLRLVTWVDNNALYFSTVIDKSEYGRDGSGPLYRVEYILPSPWTPADTMPSFYNGPQAAINTPHAVETR